MTKRVLILEDDAGVRAAALRRLELPSCTAVAVACLENPEALARQYDADLVVLGSTGVGSDPSSRLRQALRAPVVPLFRPSVFQRSRADGLPLSPGLLLGLSDCRLRIGQHLKARAMPSEMAVRWGDFTLKLEPGAFAFRGEGLGLTKVQAAFLSLLMLYSGEIVGTDVIEDVIFRGKPKSETNFISVHISRLRAKLKEKRGDIFIENIRGSGYALFWNKSFSTRGLPEPELFIRESLDQARHGGAIHDTTEPIIGPINWSTALEGLDMKIG